MAYYNVNPYKVAQFQNNLLRKVASDPRLSYGLQKQAGKGAAVGKVIGNILKWPANKLFKYNPNAVSDSTAVIAKPGLWDKIRGVALKHPKTTGAAIYGTGAAALGGGAYGISQMLASDDPAERIKGVLLSYSPYVGGGAALGALLGGGIGAQSDNTLAGSLIGGAGGAVLGGIGKAIYDKYKA